MMETFLRWRTKVHNMEKLKSELSKISQQLVQLTHIKNQQLSEPRVSGLDRLRPNRRSLHKLNDLKICKFCYKFRGLLL